MTLIIGIFIRDTHNKKEIIFASDGLAVTYKNNEKIGQDEDVEKIRKLSPKICMGYAGKNSELFEDVYDELKNKTPKKIKKELEPFKKKLQELILKKLKTKKHREIEEELKRSRQLYQKFIVGGLFQNKLILITANPGNNYKLKIKEDFPIFPSYSLVIVGMTDEIKDEVEAILKEILEHSRSYDEIENIIRFTIYEIAERYPGKINNHVFIRRLSKGFDL